MWKERIPQPRSSRRREPIRIGSAPSRAAAASTSSAYRCRCDRPKRLVVNCRIARRSRSAVLEYLYPGTRLFTLVVFGIEFGSYIARCAVGEPTGAHVLQTDFDFAPQDRQLLFMRGLFSP